MNAESDFLMLGVAVRATIRDIAAPLGVTVGTVSKALNNRPGVRPDLRRKILQKAKKLDYRPNGCARGLVTRRTDAIGLVYDVTTSQLFSNPFWGEVLAGIEEEVSRHDHALMFAPIAPDSESKPRPLPKFVSEHRVDGLLAIRSIDPKTLSNLESAGYPVVLIDCRIPGRTTDAVVSDNRSSAYMATEHLIQLGHRRIGFIGSRREHPNYAERFEGYRRALEEHDIPCPERLVQQGTLDDGYQAMLVLLDQDADMTAVVACNDVNALSAMRALAFRGRKVPEDISVVGFDDILAAAEAAPPLTTMRVDKLAMGRLGAQRLFERLGGAGTSPPRETLLAAEMVRRSSTAAPRGA